MTWGSKKIWVSTMGTGAIVVLAATGKGDPAAYGAIGMITTATIAALGAIDHKKTPPVRDASAGH